MKFGDEEWFREVIEKSEFPSDFAFYVSTDKKVLSVCLNSNVKDINNIKYRTINNWSDVALIEVVNCKTPKDYFEVSNKLRKVWM